MTKAHTDELVTRDVARAIYLVGEDWDTKNSFDTLPEYAQDYWLDRARAAIDTLQASSSARERMLEEALYQIALRGPERDIRYAGMTAKDIALATLRPNTVEEEQGG